MKIKMLETVEDSHAFVEVVDGKMVQHYDVQKFVKNQVYDHSEQYPDWDRRAAKLVNTLGLAIEVK